MNTTEHDNRFLITVAKILLVAFKRFLKIFSNYYMPQISLKIVESYSLRKKCIKGILKIKVLYHNVSFSFSSQFFAGEPTLLSGKKRKKFYDVFQETKNNVMSSKKLENFILI